MQKGKEPLSYQLIDSGFLQKLEKIGPYTFVRPSPQAVWTPRLAKHEWNTWDAKYTRFSGGDGRWSLQENLKLPSTWVIDYGGLKLKVERTDFGHIGLFAEQITNWDKIRSLVSAASRRLNEPVRVLNLFAYTGASSLAAAQAGAEVVHLDASKTSVSWARDNAALNGLDSHPIRWIVDDVVRFVKREIRRGRTYHGIILDPPSYGRGTKGEVWKIEEHLGPLMDDLKEILDPEFSFVLLSSHSAGYTPIAIRNILIDFARSETDLRYSEGEMLVAEGNGQRYLPSGAYCFLARDSIEDVISC